ncbi:DUF5134 domain-containing protein [Streptomyces yaizuensis]|uniref:DUF5134 domain-containing protein n=1 Tax=Streptomyces yaizuensis TaxID=2989713 RepID=A0ABQ5NYS7_9ACTN|nr:DUF5134 domain-containing protein [Streptomyces sp. YSPA8]GLF95345.1 DUF5134 domain-containing protein [Streptomyces sp. YSPA8]
MTGWLLVTVSVATGGYSLVRWPRRAGPGRRAAGEDGLMGLGMAAMALPVLLKGAWTVYAVVFGAAALYALRSARRRPARHLHHLVDSLTMVYMAVAMAPGTGHGGHTTAGVPQLTGVLLVYYAVYVLRSGARLARAGDGRAGDTGSGSGTGTESGLGPACRLAMALGMLAMLLTL